MVYAWAKTLFLFASEVKLTLGTYFNNKLAAFIVEYNPRQLGPGVELVSD